MMICVFYNLISKAFLLQTSRWSNVGLFYTCHIQVCRETQLNLTCSPNIPCRSDFLGTKFTIYDSLPPFNGAKASSTRSSRRFASKQISPQVPAGNFQIGQVYYKFNLLKSRGPRRMHCALQLSSSSQDNTPSKSHNNPNPNVGPLLLRNKAPRWHEHLQCWCLNFHGRVTVASVKNFQLVANDDETVLLQFGKVGDDTFTMDYRHPLSAFQAFAICLTSFGTKLACE